MCGIEEKKRQERKSNLELFRIISMILIVMHHYAVHGGFLFPEFTMPVNKVVVQIISLGGKMGVDCFVLITGYFMVDSTFKIKKLIKLVLQVLFYSLFFMTIFYGFGLADFHVKDFWKSLFPLTYSMYWFVTTYIVLYMLVPFINLFIKSLSQKNHKKLILLLFVIWSVIPTILNGDFGYSSLGLFCLLYLIAAYIKLYPNQYFNQCGKNFLRALALYLLIVASVIVLDIICLNNINVYMHETYLAGENKIPTLLCAVTLFLGFKNLRIKNSQVINTIAASTLGVYLIHDNFFVHPFLWGTLFHNADYMESPYLLLHALGVNILVFCGGIVIDQIRIILLERPFFRFIDRREEAIKGYLSLIGSERKHKIQENENINNER